MSTHADSTPEPRTGTRKLVFGILVLAFLVRIFAMLALETWSFPSQRQFGYEEGEIAYALANGQGFSWPTMDRAVGPPGAMAIRDEPVPTTWKAPVYPAIIAAAFWTLGAYSAQAAVALELFQTVLSVLTCYLLFRLGKEFFNERAGVLAALIFALYPASVHFTVQKIEYGTLLTLLGLLLIHQTLELSKRPSLPRSLLLGAVSGIAILVNPVMIAFYPFGMLWFLWTGKAGWGRRLTSCALIIGCCSAVMTPWLVRNYLVFDRLVFIRPNFTRELVVSSFPEDARSLAHENAEIFGQDGGQIFAGDDGKVSAFFNRIAFGLFMQRPADFFRVTLERIKVFWSHIGGAQGTEALVAGTAYYSMFGLGLAGMWLARRRTGSHLAMIYVLTMPIPFYLTWALLGRFRFPVEPVLILFAAYALSSLASWGAPRRADPLDVAGPA